MLDLLVTLFLLVCTAQTRFVNRTIDDTYGDPTTGLAPFYSALINNPDNISPNFCSAITCLVKPNTSLAFDGTWSTIVCDGCYASPIISFNFSGVSVWVFFILANNVSNGSNSYLASTQCTFTIDGIIMNSFSNQPNDSTQDLQYNAMVFNTSGLNNSMHELIIWATLTDASYVTFDYAIYTADITDNATSTSVFLSTLAPSSTSESIGPSASSTRATGSVENHLSSDGKIGIIVACVVVAVLIAASIVMRCIGQKKKGSIEPAIAFFHQERSHGNEEDVAISNSHPRSEFTMGLVPFQQEYHSPHPHNITSRDEIRAQRQREIDQRLHVVQQEIHNLASRQTAMRGRPSSLSSEVRRRAETEQELEDVREQMRQFRSQIERLQMDRSSDWAQGLSDDPPPAYY